MRQSPHVPYGGGIDAIGQTIRKGTESAKLSQKIRIQHRSDELDLRLTVAPGEAKPFVDQIAQ